MKLNIYSRDFFVNYRRLVTNNNDNQMASYIKYQPVISIFHSTLPNAEMTTKVNCTHFQTTISSAKDACHTKFPSYLLNIFYQLVMWPCDLYMKILFTMQRIRSIFLLLLWWIYKKPCSASWMTFRSLVRIILSPSVLNILGYSFLDSTCKGLDIEIRLHRCIVDIQRSRFLTQTAIWYL